jgi:hypothetical protein
MLNGGGGWRADSQSRQYRGAEDRRERRVAVISSFRQGRLGFPGGGREYFVVVFSINVVLVINTFKKAAVLRSYNEMCKHIILLEGFYRLFSQEKKFVSGVDTKNCKNVKYEDAEVGTQVYLTKMSC